MVCCSYCVCCVGFGTSLWSAALKGARGTVRVRRARAQPNNKTMHANVYPVNEGAPVLSRSVANGKAFLAGAVPSEQFWVVHVWGTCVRARARDSVM